MIDYTALRDLEEAHDQARAAARQRIQDAEGYRQQYQARMTTMKEAFYEVASRAGVADDSSFQKALQEVSAEEDENLADASRVIMALDEDYQRLLNEQADEREDVLAGRIEG